jgi:peptidoglycan/xylan/chitin deacetylase (PgdA/CDA1 family)
VALNVVINYEEGSEYSIPAGDNRNEAVGELPHALPGNQRDLRVESVFEYGSRVGIWRLLRVLDHAGVRATCFATAVALERNPAVATAIRDHGHEAACHGWRWSEHWLLSRDEERKRLKAAIQSMEQTCGERPQGWYSRYAPSVHTRELLVEDGGFRYDADAYNDDLPYFVNVTGTRHLVVPYTLVHNDIRYATQGFPSPRDFFEACRMAFDLLWEEGATQPRMMTIGLHPRLTGQPGRAAALRDFLDYVSRRGGVWVTRRLEIAEHWWAQVPGP